MELILEQFPVVIQSLNIGFIQTLKLFFVTLLGAVPVGVIISFGPMSRVRLLRYLTKISGWIVKGTTLMNPLLIVHYFPGLGMGHPICGCRLDHPPVTTDLSVA